MSDRDNYKTPNQLLEEGKALARQGLKLRKDAKRDTQQMQDAIVVMVVAIRMSFIARLQHIGMHAITEKGESELSFVALVDKVNKHLSVIEPFDLREILYSADRALYRILFPDRYGQLSRFRTALTCGILAKSLIDMWPRLYGESYKRLKVKVKATQQWASRPQRPA